MLAEPRILPLKVLSSNKRKALTELGQGILETRQRKPLKFIQVKSRPVEGSHEALWKHSTESGAEPHNSKSSGHASLCLGVMWLPAAACLGGASFLLSGPLWTFPYEHMAPSDHPVKGASVYFWEKVYWLTSGLNWEKVHQLTIYGQCNTRIWNCCEGRGSSLPTTNTSSAGWRDTPRN